MPIDDPAALAAEAFKKKMGGPGKMDMPGPKAMPSGVSASDGAYVGGDKDVPAGEAAAAQAMMSALKKNDPAGFARGVRNFIEICYPSLAESETPAETAAPGEEAE